MSEIRWRHSPDASHVDSGERVVVVDLSSPEPRPQVLEGTAATIWRLLEEPQTEEELVSGLLEEHADADPGQVATDTVGFIQQLAAANLVTGDL